MGSEMCIRDRCMKNNNIYANFIVREKASRRNVDNDTEDSGTCKAIQRFCEDLFWTCRLHVKFTVSPIVKLSPGLFFRILSYGVILSYLSDLYNGIGILFPFALFATVASLNFVVGKYLLKIKDSEVLVNSICGVVLPIYLDLFDVVSLNKFTLQSKLLLAYKFQT